MFKIAGAAKIIDDFQSDLARFHICDVSAAIFWCAQLRDLPRVCGFRW